MIRYVKFREAVTVPGPLSALTLWRGTEHSKLCRAELCREGVELHMGKVDDKGQWQPNGEVVTVYRGNISYVTEDRKDDPPRQQGGQKR